MIHDTSLAGAGDFDPRTITPEQFAQRIQRALEGIQAVGKEYVLILAARPNFGLELVAIGMPADFLVNLRGLGNGVIHPHWAFDRTPGGRAMCKLPIEEQERIHNQGGRVEVYDAGRPEEKRLIPVSVLTGEQVRAVISRDGVNPLAQQRTIIEKNAGSGSKTPEGDYILTGDKVHFTAYWVTADVLKKALAQLKALEGRKA